MSTTAGDTEASHGGSSSTNEESGIDHSLMESVRLKMERKAGDGNTKLGSPKKSATKKRRSSSSTGDVELQGTCMRVCDGDSTLPPGTMVVIVGLVSGQSLNGTQVEVVSFNSETGRYNVRSDSTRVSVKPQNLQLLQDSGSRRPQDSAGHLGQSSSGLHEVVKTESRDQMLDAKSSAIEAGSSVEVSFAGVHEPVSTESLACSRASTIEASTGVVASAASVREVVTESLDHARSSTSEASSASSVRLVASLPMTLSAPDDAQSSKSDARPSAQTASASLPKVNTQPKGPLRVSKPSRGGFITPSMRQNLFGRTAEEVTTAPTPISVEGQDVHTNKDSALSKKRAHDQLEQVEKIQAATSENAHIKDEAEALENSASSGSGSSATPAPLPISEPPSKDAESGQPSPKKAKRVSNSGFITPAMQQSLFGNTVAKTGETEDPGREITKDNETSAHHLERRVPEESKKRKADDIEEGAEVEPEETPRSKVGLKLVGERAPSSAPWYYVLADDRRRCYAAHLPRAIKAEVAMKLMNIVDREVEWLQPEGRFGPIPRKTAWLVKPPCSCRYIYGGTKVPPSPYPEWMQKVMEICMPLCGLPDAADWPDSCNMNLYEDGRHSVAWHADDEPLFQGKHKDCLIISLSLGSARRFDLKLNDYTDDDYAEQFTLTLADGDLCTMEGLTQKHYLHRVPKEKGSRVGPRVNFTWRWVVAHNKGCELYKPGAAAEDSTLRREPKSSKRRCLIEEDKAQSTVQKPIEKSKSALKKISKQVVKLVNERAAGETDGFVNVEELLQAPSLLQLQVTQRDFERMIRSDETKRWQLEVREGVTMIKNTRVASNAWAQDATPDIERQLHVTDSNLPTSCTHGTRRERWPRIHEKGFGVGGSGFVHWAVGVPDASTDAATGMRPGSSTVAVHFDVRQALTDGLDVYVASNGAVLSRGIDGVVPPKYFSKAIDLESGCLLWERPFEALDASAGSLLQKSEIQDPGEASTKTDVTNRSCFSRCTIL